MHPCTEKECVQWKLTEPAQRYFGDQELDKQMHLLHTIRTHNTAYTKLQGDFMTAAFRAWTMLTG